MFFTAYFWIFASFSQSLYCCPLKGVSTFVSLPPLPESRGTSAVPDLRVDPDDRDISVSSAVSPNDTEGADSDDILLETRRKRVRLTDSKLPKKLQPSVSADDSGSSSPPAHTGDEAAPTQGSANPTSKKARISSDLFNPNVLLTELSS